jgi:hypothetical protein
VKSVAQQLLALVPAACVRALRGLPETEAEVRARPRDDGNVKLQGISSASPRGNREGGDQ